MCLSKKPRRSDRGKRGSHLNAKQQSAGLKRVVKAMAFFMFSFLLLGVYACQSKDNSSARRATPSLRPNKLVEQSNISKQESPSDMKRDLALASKGRMRLKGMGKGKRMQEPQSGSSSFREMGLIGGNRLGGASTGARSGAKSKETKKSDGKKQTAQVWKRTEKGTILSKVSVGGKKFLQLKKLRVTVSVQGSRVRTVLDHIYYNPHNRTFQGTFKYTLPPESSISYYAMFVGRQRRTPRFFRGKGPSPRRLMEMSPQQIAKLSPKKDWGNLREARLVGAEKGREVFEEITRRRIDPALIEQDAPNTFSGRVFPIPAKGYNRVIIAYEQTLPQIGKEQVYRFRFPDGVAKSIDFSLDFDASLSTLARHNLRKIRCRSKQENQLLRCYWEENKPDRDAVFYFKPKQADASWTAGLDPVQNRRYLYAQLRAKLPVKSVGKGAEQAIFLLDTSLSENPDHFSANVALLKQILSKNKTIKRFNVLFFDVGSLWANSKGWIKNTPKQRNAVFAKIDSLLLEGATDISSAFQALASPNWLEDKKQGLDVFFLSDGQVSWGERSLDTIISRFQRTKRWGNVRFFAYQTGISSENVELFRRLTRSGGSVFQCLGRSELGRCATAHTKHAMVLKKIRIEGVGAKEILIAGRQANLFPGALLTIASRYKKDGTARVVLIGEYLGKPLELTYKLNLKADGDLAPRAWAELAIQQLIELDEPSQTKLIVAYSQHFRIPNKHCSFLVLETDKEYKEYGLGKEQKKNRVRDVALFLTNALAKKGAPRSAKDRWIELMRKGMKRSKMLGKSSGRSVLQLLANLPSTRFEFHTSEPVRLWMRRDVSSSYLKNRKTVVREFDPFISEAKRRLKKNQVSGAVRSLSCIVELNPSDARALRLVGYYMLGWNRPAEAAQVFLRVLERRSYEPHSYRDLARAMIKLKRYALAASLFEIILASPWHRRFGSIKKIIREEYSLLMKQALSVKKGNLKVQRLLRRRKMMLGLKVPRSRLRVTATWNTDGTDIDLWVIEPSGEKCYYSNRKTRSGGRLLEDITGGYGPERYESRRARRGRYQIKLKFYGNNSNVFGNETHVSVLILLHAGTSRQRLIEKNLILKSKGRIVKVAQIKL